MPARAMVQTRCAPASNALPMSAAMTRSAHQPLNFKFAAAPREEEGKARRGMVEEKQGMLRAKMATKAAAMPERKMLGSAKAASASTKCMPVARARMEDVSLGSRNMMMERGSNARSNKNISGIKRETGGFKMQTQQMAMKAEASEPVLRTLKDSAFDEGEVEDRFMAN